MKRPLAFACALALSALPALALDQEIITYGDLEAPQVVDAAPRGRPWATATSGAVPYESHKTGR